MWRRTDAPLEPGRSEESAEQDGDLFLFFGLYRPVTNTETFWRYARGRELHIIFGWLQVGAVLKLSSDKPPAQLERHPHVLRSSIVRNELGARSEDNNTLYVGRERMSFASDVAGAGVFGPIDHDDYDDPRRLTHQDKSCSQWRLPSFFHSLSTWGTRRPRRALSAGGIRSGAGLGRNSCQTEISWSGSGRVAHPSIPTCTASQSGRSEAMTYKEGMLVEHTKCPHWGPGKIVHIL